MTVQRVKTSTIDHKIAVCLFLPLFSFLFNDLSRVEVTMEIKRAMQTFGDNYFKAIWIFVKLKQTIA